MLISERSLESEFDNQDRRNAERYRRALEEVGPRLVAEWDADPEKSNAQLVSSLDGLSREELDELGGFDFGADAR